MEPKEEQEEVRPPREMRRAGIDADVLVVGAGPTGLMMANQLARRGVHVLVIDRHAGPVRETRALGVQARTVEVYSYLGLAERALELGKPATGVNLWARGRRMAHVPFGEAGRELTPYPFVLVLGQDDNERLLGEKLAQWNVPVQRSTELVALEQHHDHVDATLRQPDGTERRVQVAWIAGCDGAHSSVRQLNGIPFPGAPYEHVFFVADVEATGDMVPEQVNVYLWREGFHLMFPMRGGADHWRVVGILPPPLRERKDVAFEEVVPSIREELGASLAFKSCAWFSTYRISHRCASHFRDRRCFLLGDAAHIHSPVGAQGMNTGLQDAYNLAWKLALVVAGRADESLLDTYEAERLPFAQRLLHTTDRAFRLIVSDNPLAGVMRTEIIARVAAAVMRRERLQLSAFRTLSQTGDRAPWMKLRLRAGGPVEDVFQAFDDTKFHLVIAGQDVDLKRLPLPADLLCIHVLPDDPVNEAELARVKMPQTSFWLIRPDGRVGLHGTHVTEEALDAYVQACLKIRA